MADEEDLTPREKITKADGEGLLDAVRGAPAGNIVKPDGEAFTEKPASTPSAQLEQKREDEAQLVQQAAVKLRDITDADEIARRCTETMLACHQLIFWAKLELASRDNTTDFIVDVAERIMRAQVESTTKGFDVREVHGRMKHAIIPFVQERMREYGRLYRLRQQRLKRLQKGLSKKGGITLPKGLAGKFEKGFRPGDVLILHGSRGAVRTVLAECARLHTQEDGGKVYYLSAKNDYKPKAPCALMPPAWWTNACCTLNHMHTTMGTIVDDHAALTLVEDLSYMFVAGEGDPSALERRVLTLKRVYAWARENMVAVIAGDGGLAGIPPSQLYQTIPYIPVAVERVDGELFVKAGGELIPATEEATEK